MIAAFPLQYRCWPRVIAGCGRVGLCYPTSPALWWLGRVMELWGWTSGRWVDGDQDGRCVSVTWFQALALAACNCLVHSPVVQYAFQLQRVGGNKLARVRGCLMKPAHTQQHAAPKITMIAANSLPILMFLFTASGRLRLCYAAHRQRAAQRGSRQGGGA